MSLGKYDANKLLKEGLSFYFGQAALNYHLLRQDVLALNPMQSVLDETSSKLDNEELLEKEKALTRLLKAAYCAQVTEDKEEQSQDDKQVAQDERRVVQIPGLIAQCESQIQSNALSIQQEQRQIDSLELLRLALLPQIGAYDSTISSINGDLRRLRASLASTPQQIVVSSNPSGAMPPPPHSAQRVGIGGQQVAVSTSAPMPSPPVRQGNPEYGRLQAQIRET